VQLWKLPHFQLAPEEIFHLGPIPVTNTLLCTILGIVIILVLFFFAGRRKEMVPRGLQNVAEWALESLMSLVESIAGKRWAKKFFPLVATLFIFIFVSNLVDILPGVDSIGTIHGAVKAGEQMGPFLFGDSSNKIIPWLRPATTDLNLTLAMALVTVLTAQVFGFYALGAKEHIFKYINLPALKQGPVGFITFLATLLEIVQEFSRILSLSLRLFGNIFAGSVVLAVFAFLLPALVNIIFIPFEMLVAFVQAFVFSLLTLVYLQLAVTSHSHEEHGEEHSVEGQAVATH
jgi:F-type H+-transporting ATPase subunit a